MIRLHFSDTLASKKIVLGQAQPPELVALTKKNKRPRGSSCETEVCYLAHLGLQLCPDLVRHPPPQLDGLDLLALVSCVPDLDSLRYPATLFRLQRPPRLGLELGLVSLNGSCQSCNSLFKMAQAR